jgi:hypothetical protein
MCDINKGESGEQMTINPLWPRAVCLAGVMTSMFVSSSAGSTVMSCATKDGLVVSGDKLGRLNFDGQTSYLTDRKKVLPIGQDHVVMTVGQNPLELRRRLDAGGSKIVADFNVNQTFKAIVTTLGKATDADDKSLGERLHKAFEAFVTLVPEEQRMGYTTNEQGLVFSSILISRDREPGDYKLCLYQGFIDPLTKCANVGVNPLAGDFKISKIGLLGEDPVTKAITDKVKPYDLVNKQKWCQDFLLHPMPVHAVTKNEAALAMVEYMALIHEATPKMVGDTVDLFLLTPTAIETLGENMTFKQARAKFKVRVSNGKIQK